MSYKKKTSGQSKAGLGQTLRLFFFAGGDPDRLQSRVKYLQIVFGINFNLLGMHHTGSSLHPGKKRDESYRDSTVN